MGIFASCAKWVCSKVSSGYKKAKDIGKKIFGKTKEKVSNMVGAFTGKNKVEEAKKIYTRAKDRYQRAEDEFNTYVDGKSMEINAIVNKINKYKMKGQTEYIPKFIEISKKIKMFDIDKSYKLDPEFKLVYESTKLTSKSSIFKIDFDNMKFKTKIKHVLTLGFKSRKLARETLSNAEAFDLEVNQKIRELDSEKIRLAQTKESLENILAYFAGIEEIMNNLLPRLDYSLDLLKNIHLVFAFSLIKGKLDARKLPKTQLNYFQATHTFITIMSTLISRKYVEDNKVIEADIKEGKKEFNSIREVAEKIGA